jgi:hypothetical protein
MEMTRWRRWGPNLMIAALIAANGFAAFALFTRSERREIDRLWSAVSHAARQQGQSGALSGRPTVLIVLDPSATRLNDVFHTFDGAPADALDYVLVVPSEEFERTRSATPARVVVLRSTDFGADWARLLGLWDRWYLFDASGRQTQSGGLLTGGLAGALRAVTVGGASLDDEFLRAVREMWTDRQFSDRPNSRAHHSGPGALLAVSYARTGCPTDAILLALSRKARSTPSNNFGVMVPADWSEHEIEAFRWTFDITMPIYRSTAAFRATWSRLEEEYGTSNASVALVTFDAAGIQDVYSGSDAVNQVLRRMSQ